jgi:hypothetical protein
LRAQQYKSDKRAIYKDNGLLDFAELQALEQRSMRMKEVRK